jgi:ribose transport system substrate-binding protein
MQAHPDLDGWFFTGAWPLLAERGSMPLWEAAALHRGMKTIAFDTLPVELELLQDGYLSGLVGQKYWDWGLFRSDHLRPSLGRNYLPFVDSGIDIVILENVDMMRQAWDANDFSLIQPPP